MRKKVFVVLFNAVKRSIVFNWAPFSWFLLWDKTEVNLTENWIVGEFQHQGETRTFLLKPPISYQLRTEFSIHRVFICSANMVLN